jgi:sulfur carrier protein
MHSVTSKDASLTLNLKVNGQIRRLSLLTNDQSLGSVLSALAVRKELVAIALNDTIVPRAEWDRTLVSEDDRLEIVHFVGGGCHSSDYQPFPMARTVYPLANVTQAHQDLGSCKTVGKLILAS